METKEPQQKKEEARQEAIQTFLKFKLSMLDGKPKYVGFVYVTAQGRYMGCRENDETHAKKICVVSRKLASTILPEVLYRCLIIPMRGKDGFVVISAIPNQFKATIETSYIPKAVYQIRIRFGQKTILFDPKDGKKDCVRTMQGVVKELSSRVDIDQLETVIRNFEEQAAVLLRYFRKDGYYVKIA